MTVPVAQGLFEQAEDGASLIGSRCNGCDTLYFPQAPGCRNPDCPAPFVEPALLPNRGTLVTYTVQRYQPPPLFRMDDWQPYAIGLVDLGEGLEVMGMLQGMALDAVAIGMAMRVVIAPLYTDPIRGVVTTYKFAPEVAV